MAKLPFAGDITFPGWQVARLARYSRISTTQRHSSVALGWFPVSSWHRLASMADRSNSTDKHSIFPYKWFISSKARPRSVPISVCPVVPAPVALGMGRTSQLRLDPYSVTKVCDDMPPKGSLTWTSRSGYEYKSGHLPSQSNDCPPYFDQ